MSVAKCACRICISQGLDLKLHGRTMVNPQTLEPIAS
jgi:hypothetical protein